MPSGLGGEVVFLFCAVAASTPRARIGVKEMNKPTSDRFRICRRLVRDDAHEAQIAMHMAMPLLQARGVDELGKHYAPGVFLRRALARYIALILCRLLERPDQGYTGETASIASLIDMAKSERILQQDQVQLFTSDFDRVKVETADKEYDMVRALRDLRTIQLAHRLIPWKEPENDIWAHHLIAFTGAIFDLVMKLDTALAEATGVTLEDLPKSAEEFEKTTDRFWKALTASK
jgi:hypothetical protein